MIVNCDHCGKSIEKLKGHYNRARRSGYGVYCDRVCSGLARRHNQTPEERKAIKAAYDREYRKKHPEKAIYQRKYNQSEAGRAMQKRNREKFKQAHLEYCRTEEYRKWKQEYDEKYHAKKKFGEFWEAAITLKKIEEIVLPDKYEIRKQKGTYNKSQKRKRLWNSLQQTLKKHYGTP